MELEWVLWYVADQPENKVTECLAHLIALPWVTVEDRDEVEAALAHSRNGNRLPGLHRPLPCGRRLLYFGNRQTVNQVAVDAVKSNTNRPGLSTPTAGVEAPLETLSACHARIRLQCAKLRRLVPHLVAHGTNKGARTAAANVMRYFDTSTKHHHADEEEDLFPALIESMAGSDAVCLREMIAELKADHRALEVAWRRLRRVLERIAAGEPVPLAADDVEALVDLYERHIEREEKELLPMAARLLSADDLARIGHTMRERRGFHGI